MTRLKWGLASICLLLTYTELLAQWKISVKKLYRSLELDLVAGAQLPKSDSFNFFGPTFDLNENVKTTGYVLLASANADEKDTVYRPSSSAKVRIDRKDVFLYINCYAENISEYHVGLGDDQGNQYSITFKPPDNGYQIPVEVPLTQLIHTDGPGEKDKETQNDSIAISTVSIRIKKNKEKANSLFSIGELKLLKHQISEETAKGLFFHQLTGDTANLPLSFTVSGIGSCYPLSAFTIFRDTYAQSFTLQPRKQLSDNELKDSVVALLRFIISKYPYYKEHDINRQNTSTYLNMLTASGIPFENKIHRIDSLISTFSDGHFYLEKNSPAYVSGPVHVRKIKGRIQVIAVFDQALWEKIKPGDELLTIDGIPVERYMHSVTTRYFGGQLEKTNRAVSRLLYKARGDSTTLGIIANSKKKSVTYYYNKPLAIPDNFKPVHRKTLLKDNIFYYRLNRWDPGDWLNFFNRREMAKKANAIIFDLRGNTGGVEVEAFKLLSCFIRHPVHISKTSYAYNDTSIVEGPNIVVPNRFLDLSGKKVAILVDNSTACASEIFTSTLKSYAGAIVIGNEKTAGSYASGDVLYLPLNITMHVNILNKFSPNDPSGGSIEMKGITPDVHVTLNSYKDLYPYEDKILKVAYEMLGKNNLAYH